jgi:sulfite exporter TauE/SafE
MALKKPMGAFLRQKKMSSFFVLGLLNGLLPCGLVYVALGASLVMSSFVEGALYMAFFGLGTAPAMFAAVVAGSYLSTAFRLKLQKAVPIALIAIGSLFILRGMGLGIPLLSPPENALKIEATESCCSKGAPETATCEKE